MTYLVRLIKEDEGGFSVICPGLPGCVSQGETEIEALDNIREAISLYLDVRNEQFTEGEVRMIEISQVA